MAKNNTVWKSDLCEIGNRLDWLTITEPMHEQEPALENFTREICKAGSRHVVLLGMDDSSLGPEVLLQTFSTAIGYPELIVSKPAPALCPPTCVR